MRSLINKEHDQGNFKPIKTLIVMNVFVAVVLFTGLPHPPTEENMAQTFVQDLTVLSGKQRASKSEIQIQILYL